MSEYLSTNSAASVVHKAVSPGEGTFGRYPFLDDYSGAGPKVAFAFLWQHDLAKHIRLCAEIVADLHNQYQPDNNPVKGLRHYMLMEAIKQGNLPRVQHHWSWQRTPEQTVMCYEMAVAVHAIDVVAWFQGSADEHWTGPYGPCVRHHKVVCNPGYSLASVCELAAKLKTPLELFKVMCSPFMECWEDEFDPYDEYKCLEEYNKDVYRWLTEVQVVDSQCADAADDCDYSNDNDCAYAAAADAATADAATAAAANDDDDDDDATADATTTANDDDDATGTSASDYDDMGSEHLEWQSTRGYRDTMMPVMP